MKKQRLVAIAILLVCMFNFPIISLFNKNTYLLGFPIIYLYVFSIWLIGIFAVAFIAEKLNKDEEDPQVNE